MPYQVEPIDKKTAKNMFCNYAELSRVARGNLPQTLTGRVENWRGAL